MIQRLLKANLRRIGGIILPKDDVIEFEGSVVEALPNANFKVKLPNGHIVTHVCLIRA